MCPGRAEMCSVILVYVCSVVERFPHIMCFKLVTLNCYQYTLDNISANVLATLCECETLPGVSGDHMVAGVL